MSRIKTKNYTKKNSVFQVCQCVNIDKWQEADKKTKTFWYKDLMGDKTQCVKNGEGIYNIISYDRDNIIRRFVLKNGDYLVRDVYTGIWQAFSKKDFDLLFIEELSIIDDKKDTDSKIFHIEEVVENE